MVVRRRGAAAYSVAETVVALAVLSMMLAAAFQVNSMVFRTLSSQRQVNAATRTLQERLEALRGFRFSQVTDCTWLQQNLLASDPSTTASLPSLVEVVTVSAYPPAGAPIQLVRQNGSTSVNSTNAALANDSVVRVDLSISWTGGGRTRTRETSAVMAKTSLPK